MFDTNELVNEFKFVGVENVSEEIIIKCLEVCVAHNLDAEGFMEEWVAFAETNLNSKLQPSIQTVEMMVRKQFAKPEKLNIKEPVHPLTSDIKVYKPSVSTEIANILNTYNAGKNIRNALKQDHAEDDANTSNFSPASYKASVGKPSAGYAERSDSGTVVAKYGAEKILDQAKEHPTSRLSVSVSLMNTQTPWATQSCRYMFDTIETETNALQTRTNRIGQILVKKNNLEDPVEEITQQGSKLVTTFGRIRSDGDGRLNTSCVLLEKIASSVTGYSALVNLKNINACTLFPGQIVAFSTTICPGTTRHTLIPESIYTDATPDLPTEHPNVPGEDPLRIVVACGPFTLSENLAYQPLQDLLHQVVNNQPHVLILVGPFVDVRHTSVSDGTMAETFRFHFESLVENIMTPLQHLHVQVVLVASSMDAHHHCVYPTVAFELSKKYANLHLMPDPSLVSVNGLIVGVTSVDVLFHLARVELNWPAQKQDRIARFASHILSQQSFYPLYPPLVVPGQKLNVDQALLEKYGKMPVVPHILILPSNFGHFIKNVNGSIVINPERLSKGFVGGTFACIDVHPVKEGTVADNITCKIIKI